MAENSTTYTNFYRTQQDAEALLTGLQLYVKAAINYNAFCLEAAGEKVDVDPYFIIPNQLDSWGLTNNWSAFYTAIYQADLIIDNAHRFELTEEELFTRFDTVIFQGTVLEIKNVFPDFIMSKDFLDRVGDNYERIQTKEERLIEDYFNRFIPYSYIVYEDSLDFDYVEDYMEEEDERTYERYAGSYAQDVMGYSDEDIDTIFDGDPDAYWNID